jgi:hypothetical protein
MSLSVIQTGTNLQLMSDAGVLSPVLALPTGVTLRSDVPPRFIVFRNYAILVNTPSQPLTIDSTGTVRLLSPKAPRLAPTLSGVAGGTLTGNFRVRYTFTTEDSVGNLISESDFSSVGGPTTIAANFLKAANLDVSPDQITGRRLYRTTDSGAVYFQWVDLPGNVLTSVQDDLADAGLSLFAAPVLGTPPRLTSIAEFRGRLFGVGDTDKNHLRYTEAGIQYAWPEDNLIEIPALGSDEFGIVALAGRRETLGVGRRNMLVQITGTGAEDVTTGLVDFDQVILSKELGIESQESVRVFRDTAYFLWKDGVYSWNSEGITCISDGAPDGHGSVRTWFVTDSYFNRDLFTKAFAHIDASAPRYRLFLASAGSDFIDRWVEYDINDKTWWGPHKTGLFSPTSAFNRTDASDKDIPVIGSVNTVYNDQATRTDGTATAISLDVIGKRHDIGEPDLNKYFGQLSLFGKAQTSGTLTITSHTGELESTQSKIQAYDMTIPRQRLARIGQGKHTQIQLTNAEAGVDVELFGYMIDPVNVIGRR